MRRRSTFSSTAATSPTVAVAALATLLSLLSSSPVTTQIFAYQLPTIRHIEEQPSHHLQQDIMDFIDLVPFDDVQTLMQYYYHYDTEVENAFDYVSTEDYSQIKLEIMNLSEVQSFRRYLDGIGFSVEQVWKDLCLRFDVEDVFVEPDDTIRNLNLTTRGLNGLVDDILALLPQDEIILLFFDKLETSNDFSYFFEQIGSGDFENVLNMLQQSIMKFLAVIAFAATAAALISTTSGDEPSPRSLQDDFNEFVELLPFDEIVDVSINYLLNDKDVQQALQYLYGPEFSSIWDQVFALKEVRDVLDYLELAGVEAYAFFNDIAALLGLGQIKPAAKISLPPPAGTRGLNDFVDDLLALLPKDELFALFEHKLETSAEFRAFFETVKSTDFQKLLEFANSSTELKSLFQKLRDHGVDVDKFFDLIKGFFGWSF
ncbi:uncharacterized protein LOC109430558 [Aedes albopictus]|uniref:Insect allergen related repeat protein n=1 Tax=Aedes albopictus TaxID=7160 RepID=A0ABM1ZG21_AEDAL